MASSGNESFPTELQERLTKFDVRLSEVEDILKPLHDVPINEWQGKMNALERAKLDLLGAYTMNSLFWIYLNTKGENPKEHGVKQELDRIRTYMGRVKDIEDRAKAPKLDKGATKRFVRNALWQNAHKQVTPGEGCQSSAETSTAGATAEGLEPSTEGSTEQSQNATPALSSEDQSEETSAKRAREQPPSSSPQQRSNRKNKKKKKR